MTKVVFACVHNAGRSQMAAAWFNHLNPKANIPKDGNAEAAGSDRASDGLTESVAVSAGTSPAARVHPAVVEVMREAGIDLSSARPQKLTADLVADADLLVTMGCGDDCPYVPGLRTEDWALEDPRGKPLERVREIRDEIRNRVADLLRRS